MGWLNPAQKRQRSQNTVNLASPVFKSDPFPFYARLRAETPVHRIVLPTNEIAWLITRYDDVAAVLKDERFVKDPRNALTPEQAAELRPQHAKPAHGYRSPSRRRTRPMTAAIRSQFSVSCASCVRPRAVIA